MIPRINTDCFLKQHYQVDVSDGDALRFLCGRNWLFKEHLDGLRLLRVKDVKLHVADI
jgi:hypothetical protein